MAFLNRSIPELLHPLSGIAILGLDWILFSGNVLTLGLSTLATGATGIVLGTLFVMWLQLRYTDDTRALSIVKGVLSGIAVGIPLPIAGTGAGGLVLALSGLNRLGKSDDEPREKLESDR